jgi:hypothetical protein
MRLCRRRLRAGAGPIIANLAAPIAPNLIDPL